MSTIKVTNIDPPSAGGAVNVNGLGYPNAGPLSNRNLVINGAFQVAQRGTSSTSSDFRTVDRFYYNFGNTLAGTQSQQSLSSGTPYNEGFRNFYRFAISTPGSATSTYCQLIHPIEAQNLATSGWDSVSSSSYVTVSFWVRSSVAQTFYGALKTDDGTAQNYVFSFALSADTWTKVEKTIPGNSNVTINNDNGLGAELKIYPFMGTNYSDSGVNVDAWQAYTGGTRVPDMATTWMSTNGATFDVTGVQLEVGSVATPFEHRSYGDELARCQRYFRRYCEGSSYKMSPCVFIGNTSTVAYGNMNLVPSMRAVPSSDFSSIRIDDQNSGQAVTSFSVSTNSTNDSLYLTAQTASGLTQFRLYYIMANGTSSGRLDFSAEL